MSSPTDPRLRPGPREIKVRLYGQGVGDCFLLAFPRPGGDPCYLVIDCGVAKSTPDKVARTRQIVNNLHQATGGKIDVLVVTHQHYDHVSSFQDAWQEWQTIEVGALYLPWTESSAEKGEHSKVNEFRQVLERAARAALERARDKGELDDAPAFRAQADFLGIDLGDGDEAGDTLALERPSDIDDAMEFARKLAGGKVRYFWPGDVFVLPGTGSHAYVLGPPRPGVAGTGKNKKAFIELLSDEAEMYSYHDVGLTADIGKPGGANAFALSDDRGLPALASSLLAAGRMSRDADEGFCPFAGEVRIDWENAMASPFFSKSYGDAEATGPNGEWRRIDTDWLDGGASLALRAGEFTNNVSMVLAFDLPDSDKMLLFPGDAQVGNWLSWHAIEGWNFCDESQPKLPPAPNGKQTLMENLLSRVVFYKVGHHGSHNATLRDRGLELMTNKDLVAFIPVSVPVAQDLMGYCPMPFYPVLRALQRKTGGKVFLPNGHAVEPLPPDTSHQQLMQQAGITPAAEKLPAKINKGKNLEGEVPLYLELTLGA